MPVSRSRFAVNGIALMDEPYSLFILILPLFDLGFITP
jgi:hypothetical protein